ncbi:uncharacterized protein [Nicotiana tomentosiformis]|uniref:uncharacterized protein n=1 Tax=Nicotiana tomentosiformis TaxID=4098 RepID=UPI00388C8D66
MAENEEFILGIWMPVDVNIKEFLVIGASNLLIHQVQVEWTTKNVKILPYLHCVNELCKKFTKIEFRYIPRIQNEFADALTILSSMIQNPNKNYIDPIKIEVRDKHVYCFHLDEEPDGSPWYYNIKMFLQTRDYPENVTNASRLLEEIHTGTYRPRMNGFTLEKKILRVGYFLMTMESDSICYVQKCHQCQIHGNFI